MKKIKIVHTHDWNDNCRHYYKDCKGNVYCRYFNEPMFYTCTHIGEPCDPVDPERFEIVETLYLLEDLRELAVRAHSLTSHVPEDRGEQIIKEHSAELESDLEFVRQNGGDERRYMENYRKYFSAWLGTKSRCVSWMITGRANFPTKRAEKANNSEHNRSMEFREWRERARKAVAQAGRRADRAATSEVDEVRKKIAEAEAAQDHMKRANAIIRKHRKNPAAAVPVLMEQLALTEKRANELIKPDCCGDIGFAPYSLQNNNANIRRMQERLVELERKEAASGQETKSLSFNGGEIEMDFQEDRIRILYPGKPDVETIADLKRHGFRWSPSNCAWQRQLTSMAIHGVIAITDADAKALFELYRQAGR